MKIEFQTQRVVLPEKKQTMMAWLKQALPPDSTLTIRFVGSAEGRKLNAQFRHKDYATNVLTFNYSLAPVNADLVLCMPVVRLEARQQNKLVKHHLAHLLVHGCLHAQGLNHQSSREAKAMERREVEILRHFGISDPYQVFD